VNAITDEHLLVPHAKADDDRLAPSAGPHVPGSEYVCDEERPPRYNEQAGQALAGAPSAILEACVAPAIDRHLAEMALGDWRYRTRVPQEIRQQAAADSLGEPEWYVPALEAPSQFPESARVFLAAATKRLAVEAPELLQPADLDAIGQFEAEESARSDTSL
jgi:hypothetical protein